MKKVSEFRNILFWFGATLAAVLVLTVTVLAADPYWQGHKWSQSRAAYEVAEWTMPTQFVDDIVNAANKWNEPSPFYFYRVPVEPPPGEGGVVSFGTTPEWAAAYTEPSYCGDDICDFYMTFDANLPQGWTDEPCWHFWNHSWRVFSVALHEFGHVVDFKSVSNTNTVMYSRYRCYTNLYQRDKDAIDDLY